MQGRFTSPDNPLVDQDPTDPQSLNLYSYVRNRPLAHTDRNGRACYNGNSGSGYCKRAAEYRNYDADPAVREKTRFFAAAAVVSEVNATGDPQISEGVAGKVIGTLGVLGRKAFSISGSTHSALSSIGQELQKLNATTVQDIRDGKLGGPDLDAKLVHLEQSALQGQLDSLKKSDIGKYNTLISEANSILNPSGLTRLGTKAYSTDSAFVTKILDPARKQLGRNIDFTNQQDRELIGNTLVKYIRDGGCDVGTINGCK